MCLPYDRTLRHVCGRSICLCHRHGNSCRNRTSSRGVAMTIEECNKAAYCKAPVICRDVMYKRIAKISRVFTSDELMLRGWKKTYYVVTLEDRTGRSFTEANPEDVELAETVFGRECDGIEAKEKATE